MDIRFINPLLSSIVNVLSTMAALEAKPGKPVIKQGVAAPGVVTGMIELKGAQATGSIAISLTRPVILDIARRMLRQEFDEVDDMVVDLAGELANMMAGGGKAQLSEQGYEFDLTLPNVIAGTGHDINHTVNGPVVTIPFQAGTGEFFVEVCFAE